MIYFPVWIDQFGIYEQRTIWLSFLQLGPALGTMLGYAIEAIGIRLFNTWRFGFYFQCVVLIGITALFLLTPDKTFSTHYKRTNLTREFIQNGIEPSTALYRQYNVINGNKYDRLSDFSIYVLDDIEETKKEFNYIDVLKSLLIHNRVYLYTLSGICCLLFIITGIEFWITDYMVTILKQEENKVYITFAIVCISAPTLGVLLGGYLIDNLGGYTDKRALQTCFHFSVVSGCCGIPLPFVNSFWLFVLLMWFTLFFGGSIMPGLTGILLASIDDDGKEASNSITHFLL
jgi:MFS family permease